MILLSSVGFVVAMGLGGRMIWFSNHHHTVHEWAFLASLGLLCGLGLFQDQFIQLLQVLPFTKGRNGGGGK